MTPATPGGRALFLQALAFGGFVAALFFPTAAEAAALLKPITDLISKLASDLVSLVTVVGVIGIIFLAIARILGYGDAMKFIWVLVAVVIGVNANTIVAAIVTDSGGVQGATVGAPGQ